MIWKREKCKSWQQESCNKKMENLAKRIWKRESGNLGETENLGKDNLGNEINEKGKEILGLKDNLGKKDERHLYKDLKEGSRKE